MFISTVTFVRTGSFKIEKVGELIAEIMRKQHFVVMFQEEDFSRNAVSLILGEIWL